MIVIILSGIDPILKLFDQFGWNNLCLNVIFILSEQIKFDLRIMIERILKHCMKNHIHENVLEEYCFLEPICLNN